MTTRLLLAVTTTAALLAGTQFAAAQATVTGGAALFTLPPMPGFAFQAVGYYPAPLSEVISAPAFGVVPVYGFTLEIPTGPRFGIFAGGFRAAAGSSVGWTNTGENLTLAVYSPYEDLNNINAYGYFTDPAVGGGNVGTGLYDDGYAFAMGFAGDDTQFYACHDPGNGCSNFVDATGTAAGPAFGYATVLSDGGVLVAIAGVLPADALTISETAGFSYFGGQGGLSANLDIAGNATLTAYAGAIFRSLHQFHATTLDVAFDVPIGIDTLSVAQTVTTEEDLLSRYTGAIFGLSLQKDIGILTAGIDVGFAPLFMQTTYTGQQASTLQVTGPATDFGTTTDLAPNIERITRGAALINVAGNVGFRFGDLARLTFGGYFEFLSAAPGVQHDYIPGANVQVGVPSIGYINPDEAWISVNNSHPNNLGNTPAHVFFNPMMTYGASVTLSIGLGAR